MALPLGLKSRNKESSTSPALGPTSAFSQDAAEQQVSWKVAQGAHGHAAEMQDSSLEQQRADPEPAVVPDTGGPAVAADVPLVSGPAPTAEMRQLVARVVKLDLSSGAITPEQAQQWKQALHELLQQGGSAVPAIREFLDQNLELNFADVRGENLLGYSSARTALIETLQQMGGPEALAAQLHTLQTATLPSEIALLARDLEERAPGQYRQEILNAVRETLTMASQEQLHSFDVGPLFQLIQTYGDASVVAELQANLSQWKYYGAMALANLPEGAGIPALVQIAQDASHSPETSRSFALEMLAQSAAQYPEARAALLEQARLNQIPSPAWREIALILAGDQYQFGHQLSANGGSPGSDSTIQNYHVQSGQQNFAMVPLADTWSVAQISQQVAVIDQLLAVNNDPSAVQLLQQQRTLLAARLTQ
jgi:hypothetical protein